MQPLSAALIKGLELKEAFEAELADHGNLLPPPPGFDEIAPYATEVESWLRGQLQAGLIVAPQQVVNARKSGHGIRPVPIVGIIERTVYRALVDFILRNEPDLDRSPSAYIGFVQAPVLYAGDLKPEGEREFLTVLSSDIRYVVKTDITAFYQYVDHAVLASELVAKTGEYQAITALVELLGELQGRQHGLPQLLRSSDRLSEVYIDIAERDLLRQGLAVWRFNDDFRIACRDYPETLRAIEALDEAARQIGLVISEYKTFTPTFTTYAFDTLGLQVDDTIPEGETQDVEGAVADYTEIDETAEAEHSLELVQSARAPGDGEPEEDEGVLHLGDLSADDVRRLRRALRNLARAQNPDGLERLTSLLIYAPALTPSVANYLTSVAPIVQDDMSEVFDTIRDQVSLSDWQAHWLVHVAHSTRLLEGDPQAQDRVDWAKTFLRGRFAPHLRAEATLALATVGEVSLDDIEYGLRNEPSVLSFWYLAAVKALAEFDAGAVPEKRLSALSNTSRLYRWLLQD